MTTIEMKTNGGEEWVPSGEISERKEMSPEKRAAIKKILEYFYPPFEPIMASIYYPKLKDKYVEEKILDQKEIDEIAKPHAIENLKAVLKSELFDVFISTTNKWQEFGVINDKDKAGLFKSEQVKTVAFEYIRQLINHAWTIRKHVPYPKKYTSLIWGYVLEGVISSEEAQKLWDEPLKRDSQQMTLE